MTETDSAVDLAHSLDPVRAAELKRQRNAQLARSLAGAQPETDPEAALDAFVDRVAERLLEKLEEGST
jgi:hypothetical protein